MTDRLQNSNCATGIEKNHLRIKLQEDVAKRKRKTKNYITSHEFENIERKFLFLEDKMIKPEKEHY